MHDMLHFHSNKIRTVLIIILHVIVIQHSGSENREQTPIVKLLLGSLQI